VSAGALEAIDRVLNRGGVADEVLRQVLTILHERGGAGWAGIAFVEESGLVPGPAAGGPQPEAPERHDVAFQGQKVAELQVSSGLDRAFLERVAVLISAYCLVGWDTGGEPRDP
jgi:hypothetical protein